MRSYLGVLIIFLAFVNIAFGAVSESSVSEGSASDNVAQIYPAGMSTQDGTSFVPGYTGQQNGVPYNLPYQQSSYPYSGYGAVAGAYPNSYATTQPVSLPPGAPTPPNPNAENLILPDYNQYAPVSSQAMQGSVPAMGGPQGYAVSGGMPMQSNYPAQGGYSANGCQACSHQGSHQGANPSQTCTSCTGQTPVTGANSLQGNCATCTGSSMAAPAGYPVQNCQAVFPKPSTCRCNEYYVQICPGKLGTTAGVYCGQWLPLWSKISRPGTYWSFEWALCGNPPGSFCPQEIRNFGSKGPGWCQTWFWGNKPGWHILSYCCGDWSNYVYIYVWPAN
jgi:hypothetical protein